MNSKICELPLINRQQVLFPGSVVSVRLVEPRQVDQLKTATEGRFGFSLYIPAEDKKFAQHMQIGTEAIIEDYSQCEGGGLQLKLRGGRRFLIQQTRCLHDGQIVARVKWRDNEATQTLPIDYAPMAQVVARYMEKIQSDHPQYRPLDCEDASFIGFRLAELLPMELVEKQMLLELTDPVLRLKMLATILPRFQ